MSKQHHILEHNYEYTFSEKATVSGEKFNHETIYRLKLQVKIHLILLRNDLCFRFLRVPTSQYLYYSKTLQRVSANSRQSNIKTKNI